MRRVEAGLVLGGHTLRERLGFGAGGEVWRVEREDGSSCALKCAERAQLRLGAADEARFRREFEQLRTLRLPNVVRVHDIGADDHFVWFTMDVARGRSFDQYVQEGVGLADRVGRLVRAGAGVARALAAIHRLGLAHRDLKPANLLVDEDGRPTVLDFGTARFAAAHDASSELMGTVSYMAPEQRIGLPHDRRVDIYALGVTLHEAFTGIPAGSWKPGRPRTALCRMGPEVDRALSWLIDRMLALDPAARPTAPEVESVLVALDEGGHLAPAPWPAPPSYTGDATPLLSANCVVTGHPGTGRRRMVQEARWQWYRKGYRSIAGRCVPERPFGPFRAILRELFATASPARRRDLAGDEAPLLQALWPGLPVPVVRPAAWPPDPRAAAEALGRTLARRAPLAIVLWEVDEADVGTAAVLEHLVRAVPEGVRIWATGRRALSGLRAVRPPGWSSQSEREVLPELIPEGLWPEGPPAATPLESCARGWSVLARYRGEAPPHRPTRRRGVDEDLKHLALLEEPFPVAVARRLCEDLDQVIESGHLAWTAPGTGRWEQSRPVAEASDEPTETTDLFARHRPAQGGEDDSGRVPRVPLERMPPDGRAWLRFADPSTRLLARAAGRHRKELRRRVAQAWAHAPPSPERSLRYALQCVRAGNPQLGALREAVDVAVVRGEPAEVERWLQLLELHGGGDERWDTRFATLFAASALRPDSVDRGRILALGRDAGDEERRGKAGWLLLRDEIRSGDAERAAAQGRRWADSLTTAHPGLAAALRREAAEAWRVLGRADLAVADGRLALALARESRTAHTEPAEGLPVSFAEVQAGVSLAGALVESGELEEAISLCNRLVPQAAAAGLERGEGGLLATLARAQLLRGARQAATDTAARCRNGQPRHRDPHIHAACALVRARLAVELGDLAAGDVLLDEARAAAQALRDRGLTVAASAVALEAALQRADAREARRALAILTDPTPPHPVGLWPTAGARWRWMRGDLPGAIALLGPAVEHKTHAGCTAAAERARLLLVAGRYAEARRAAEEVVIDATVASWRELALFGRLVAGAADQWPDHRYAELVRATRRSRQVHLYLGALHLDAIRRRLRGEPVGGVLAELRARAGDLHHRLYTALAREDGW